MLNFENCSGCTACYNICPQNAITMKENSEGFLYPFIDEKKCINCGLCKKICQTKTFNLINNNYPIYYAAMASDFLRLNKSSSGAFFTIAAEYIISQKGVIFGAAFDENYMVKHILVDNYNDLEKLKGSKYVQSDLKDIFKQCKKYLDRGILVLFSGTPCQISGLKKYLNKEYENLLLIDIICHGVPSPLVWKKYLLENININNINSISFRNKDMGWYPPHYFAIDYEDGTKFRQICTENDYYKSFLNNLSLRKSCYNCVERMLPLSSDITIGDFWGIDNWNKEINDNKGTSLVIINNVKGQNFLDKIKENFKILIKIDDVDVPKISNNHLIKINLVQSPNRKLFFQHIKNNSLNETIKICLEDKCDFVTVNNWYSNWNYGAVLTAYALQELIKSFGFICKVLDTKERDIYKDYKLTVFNDFVNKFLDTTKPYSIEEVTDFTKNLKGVIVGSDQVFNLVYELDPIARWRSLLNFVDISTPKFAISASFGLGYDDFCKKLDKSTYQMMKSALSSFDAYKLFIDLK